MATKELYLVEVKRPDGVTIPQMTAYIEDAVSSWKGGYHPDHPLFGLPEAKARRATHTRLMRAADPNWRPMQTILRDF